MLLREVTNIDELAICIGKRPWQLKKLLYSEGGIEKHYSNFVIAKKTGGEREIDKPDKELRLIQKAILKSISDNLKSIPDNKLIFPAVVQAYVKKRSIYTNSLAHRNKKILLKVDLENFFPSIHFGRVKGFLEKNNRFLLPSSVATSFAQLVCYKSLLPQGACTSPIISNLIASSMDQRIMQLAKKYHLKYTRYADDLIFSTNDYQFIQVLTRFMEELDGQIVKNGFQINWKKVNITGENVRHSVTGLVNNKKIAVPHEYSKLTRSMAHSLYTKGKYTIDKQTITDSNLSPLEGRFTFINDIDRQNNTLYKKNSFEYVAVRTNNKSHALSKTNEKVAYNVEALSSREKAYRVFLFFKYFYKCKKPLIITEGKTDVTYLKTALMSKNKYHLDVCYLNKADRLNYFFGLVQSGDSLQRIPPLYDKLSRLNISNTLDRYGVKPDYPVVLLFDHEMKRKDSKNSPIQNFANSYFKEEDSKAKKAAKEKFFKELHTKGFVHLKRNLYVAVISKPGKSLEDSFEIEDLFPDIVLKNVFGLGTFESKYTKANNNRKITKNDFSLIIRKNKKKKVFGNFDLLLSNINTICNNYQKNKNRYLID